VTAPATPSPAGARRIGPPRRVVIDVRASLALCGTMLKYLSPSAAFPAAIALWYREPVWPFVAAGLIAAAAGLGLERAGRGRRDVGLREGYLVVSLTWLLGTAYGALPFLLSGEPQLDRPVDAMFESMSGFTTTGASVLTDIEALDRSVLMWRMFTHWLGGLGIVVLALAVLPRLRVGGRQILESEAPGPEFDQLGTRIRETVKQLWLVYVGLSALQAAILCTLGWTGVDEKMDPYRAVAHTFATISTGGFSTENTSLVGFSAATQWVVATFMLVAGLNFALLWIACGGRRPGRLLRDEEARWYLAIFLVVTAVLVVEIVTNESAGRDDPLRHAVFTAATIITTTGLASIDFATWGTLGLLTVALAMLVGGSAGSTTGSIKVIRHVLLAKVLRREVRQAMHPELVIPVRFNARTVDEQTLRSIVAFMLTYLAFFLVGAAVLAIEAAIHGPDLTPLDALAVSAATLGNVGASLGPAGPMSNYESFGDVSSVVMIGLMWAGRLEIVPVVVLLTRRYWRP
jgi:trk system potassium uptake protein TrkH